MSQLNNISQNRSQQVAAHGENNPHNSHQVGNTETERELQEIRHLYSQLSTPPASQTNKNTSNTQCGGSRDVNISEVSHGGGGAAQSAMRGNASALTQRNGRSGAISFQSILHDDDDYADDEEDENSRTDEIILTPSTTGHIKPNASSNTHRRVGDDTRNGEDNSDHSSSNNSASGGDDDNDSGSGSAGASLESPSRVLRAVRGVSGAVRAAWARMGVPPRRRQARWRRFLSQALLPFLEDFRAAGEDEERAAARRNDECLREVRRLCARLRLRPRSQEVAAVLDALDSSGSGGEEEEGEGGAQRKRQRTEDSALSEVGGSESFRLAAALMRAERSEDSLQQQQQQKYDSPRGSAELRAFAALAESLQRRSRPSGCAIAPAKRSRGGGRNPAQEATHEGSDAEDTLTDAPPPSSALVAALERLIGGRTHAAVHRLLTREATRLRRAAAVRLCLLSLVAGQRASLGVGAARQCRMRRAAAEQFLTRPHELTAVDEASRCEGLPSGSPGSKRSGGHPTGANESGAVGTAAAEPPSGTHDGESPCNTHLNNEEQPASGPQTEEQALEGDEELRLLMAAPSINLENTLYFQSPSRASMQTRHTFLLRPTLPPSAFAAAAAAAATQRSVLTSRAPATSPVAANSNNNNINNNSVAGGTTPPPQARLAAPEDSEEEEETAAEWAAAAAAVQRLGTRQDLSAARVSREAAEVRAALAAHNATVEAALLAEERRLRGLFAQYGGAGREGAEAQSGSPRQPAEMTSEMAEEGEESEAAVIERLADLRAQYRAALQAAEAGAAGGGGGTACASPVGEEGRTPEEVEDGFYIPAKASAAGTEEGEEQAAESGGGGGAVTVIIPRAVRELLALPSLAPALAYAQAARARLQTRVLRRHTAALAAVVAQSREALSELDGLYNPSSYRGARDWDKALEGGLAWLPAAERAPLRRRLLLHFRRAAPLSPDAADVADGAAVAAALGEWLAAPLPPDRPTAAAEEEEEEEQATKDGESAQGAGGRDAAPTLEERVDLLVRLLRGGAAFLEGARRRLCVLRALGPLVAARREILEERRQLQEGSRERLLSKKINMAKQLFHEERVRRRMARELPRAEAQIAEAAAEWAALPTDLVTWRALSTAGEEEGGAQHQQRQPAEGNDEEEAESLPPLPLCVRGERVVVSTEAAAATGTGGGESNNSTASNAHHRRRTGTASNSSSAKTSTVEFATPGASRSHSRSPVPPLAHHQPSNHTTAAGRPPLSSSTSSPRPVARSRSRTPPVVTNSGNSAAGAHGGGGGGGGSGIHGLRARGASALNASSTSKCGRRELSYSPKAAAPAAGAKAAPGSVSSPRPRSRGRSPLPPSPSVFDRLTRK